MDHIVNKIRQLSLLSKEGLDLVLPFFTRIEYKRGDEIIRYGKPCQSLFIIEKGFCRAFNIQDGLEVNLEFFFEYDTVTNKNSYLFNQPSSFTVVACESMIVYKINKADIQYIISQRPELEIAGKKNLESIVAKQEKQLQLFRILTAKGRYEFLEKNDPELLQRVSISQLASYLGVKRETLSRIRNKRKRPAIL
jgi:CRP-like cAMP-binding protein